MKKIIFLLFLHLTAFSQSDRHQIDSVLNLYFEGWATGDTTKLSKAMHHSCQLKNYRDGNFYLMTKESYLKNFSPRARPNGLETNVVYIDDTNDLIAGAKVEISTLTSKFTDYFNLLKTNEGWFIVDKISTNQPHKIRLALPQKEVVMSGINRPWSMAFLSDNEALISEKEGDLIKVNLATKQKTIIKGYPSDLIDSIGPWGDNSGKFEVLADPKFSENKYVYLSYAAQNERGYTTKVVRAELENDELKNIKDLLIAEPYTKERYHYGGGMTFGHDGKLYISIGGRLFNEKDEPPMPISQDVKDKRGKIYRINTDGTIPSDNPDFGSDGIPGLYALGIRATQGLTLNPTTQKIWFTEHGTYQGDEVNVLQAKGNYGWPIKTTGKYRYDKFVAPKLVDTIFTDPIWYWPHTVAPTGLTFYTGDAFPTWKGSLLVPGLSKGSLWRLTLEGEKVKHIEELFLDSRVRSRKIVQSPRGRLYLLTDEVDGKILWITNNG